MVLATGAGSCMKSAARFGGKSSNGHGSTRRRSTHKAAPAAAAPGSTQQHPPSTLYTLRLTRHAGEDGVDVLKDEAGDDDPEPWLEQRPLQLDLGPHALPQHAAAPAQAAEEAYSTGVVERGLIAGESAASGPRRGASGLAAACSGGGGS